MPTKETLSRAKKDEREGKAPTTQAGEFVREEIEHVRHRKHGAASPKQVIAIGLSKARRAGVKLPTPKRGTTSAKTRARAEKDATKGRSSSRAKPSPKRSRATTQALRRKGRAAASREALSKQTKDAAATRKRRGTASRRPRRPHPRDNA
jgi:hypothetical protein